MSFLTNCQRQGDGAIILCRKAMIQNLDEQILGHLKQNAHMSFSELATKLNVSRATIQNHVSRMEDNKTIQRYTVILRSDIEVLSPCEHAFFFIKFSGEASLQKLRDDLSGMQEVHDIWAIAGEWDCIILAAAPTLKALNDLRPKIKHAAEIERMETRPILDIA